MTCLGTRLSLSRASGKVAGVLLGASFLSVVLGGAVENLLGKFGTDLSESISALPYLLGLASGLVGAVGQRRYVWLAFAMMFLLIVGASAAMHGTTLMLVGVLCVLTTAPLSTIVGGTSSTVRRWWAGLPAYVLIGSVAALAVATIQIVAGARGDEITALANSSRAPGTMSLLVGLPVVAALLVRQTPTRVTLLVWLCLVAWLADAKAAIVLITIAATPGLVYILVTRKPSPRSRALSTLSVGILFLTCTASLAGFGTIASAPAANMLSSEMSQGVTNSLETPMVTRGEVGSSNVDKSTDLMAGVTVLWLGAGPGTGPSVTTLLSLEGKLGEDARPTGAVADTLIELITASISGPGSGTIRSPIKTLSGLATEVGVIGLSAWLALLITSFVVAIQALSRNLVPSIKYLPLFSGSLVFASMTAYFEYIELGLALGLFALALQGPYLESHTGKNEQIGRESSASMPCHARGS